MTRLAILVITLTFLIGCGDGAPTAPSPTSGVQFRLDSNSCSFFGTAVLTFTFFVDGAQVGSAPLGLNQTSPAFTIAAGSHVASASVTNTTVRWNNINFSVIAGQTFVGILTCS